MSSRTFFLLIALATLVRIAALPLPGTEDVRIFRIWSYASSSDVTRVYGVGGDPPIRGVLEFGQASTTANYPPLAIYEMSIVGIVYRVFDPGFTDDWHLTAAVKVPGFLAGATLTWLLYLAALGFTGRVEVARWVALAYWLNPATILNGEVLGYLEPLVMLPAVGSLIALHRRRPVAAGLMLAMALLTKPQGALVVPAFLLASWHAGQWRELVRVSVACAAGLVAGVLPFVLVGALPNMLQAFGSFVGRRDILSGYAANFWWIVTWQARAWNMIPEFGVPGAYLEPIRRILAISSYMELGLPNPRPLGTAMVAVTCAWGFWQGRRCRDLALHAALAAFTVQAYFVWGVSAHEHHLMLAVPLLALAAALRPVFRPIFYAVSLICALNMNLFYGISLGWGWAFPRTATPIDASVLLAFVSIGVLFWYARVLSAEVKTPAARYS